MKRLPVRPGHRRLRAGAAALLLAFAAAAPAQAPLPALPSLGDGGSMSAAAERRLGDRIARELYRDPDYIDDPVVADYLDRLWQPLLGAARARGDLPAELQDRFAWRILLGKDRSINAFALPGGWLGVHMGLVATTATRDELASVLAHELSHVTQRHISRLLGQQSRQAPWVLAATILGALAASKNPEAGQAVIAGSQALAAQNQLNFSRDMEREADRIGFGLLGQAGFEPQGFVTMFEKLQQAARLNDNGAFPYLRTHPLTTERAADMASRQQLGPRNGAGASVRDPSLEHALVAARARVLSNGGVDALRALVSQAEGPASAAPSARQAAHLYAGALAASRLREPAQAERLYARLLGAIGPEAAAARLVQWLGAEIALGAGDSGRALQRLQAPGASSGSRPELILMAQARLRAGKGAESVAALQDWVGAQPQDATAWQLLSAAYAQQGQALRALRAEAEAQVAVLDYAAAVDRFKAAQELARRTAAGPGADHIEASIIDTRTREVESLAREQALER